MQRSGKKFEVGNPFVHAGGLDYYWPQNSGESYSHIFERNKKTLGDLLLRQARGYIREFGFNATQPYPYLKDGRENLTIHIGTDGRWVEVGKLVGNGMGAFHNLDGYKERMVGFNLVSDALERLDQTIAAPRIRVDKSGTIIATYPLPKGYELVPRDNAVFDEDFMRERHEELGLGGFKSLTMLSDTQVIESENGSITINRGVCTVHNKARFYVPRATPLAAMIVDLCTMRN